MNKLSKVIGFAVLVSFLTVGSAVATPIFVGDPVADFGSAGLPTDPRGPGYYIWANDENRTSWSVRWTGRDWMADEWDNYSWGGEISFSNSEGIDDAVKVLWDSSDGDLTVNEGLSHDNITFGIAEAGPHWDGFDFTLTGVSGDYLTFILDSTFFTPENDGVYIGQNMVSVLDFCDSPADFRSGTGTNRQFEIYAPAPEPATLLLFGSGLIGLAVLIKRKKTEE